MDQKVIIDGLIWFVCILAMVTVHEFGHAWVAWKCGDDTARLQGRVTLNPVAHMDLVGTLLLPLLIVVSSAFGSGLGGFLVGWGKPVPVNIYNLRHRRLDDVLVSLAGPAMNVVLAAGAMALARAAAGMGWASAQSGFELLALISMYLCFFNLLPLPPLDGSRVLWNVLRLKDETFLRLSQFGFLLVIVAIQSPLVRTGLSVATFLSLHLMKLALLFPGAS